MTRSLSVHWIEMRPIRLPVNSVDVSMVHSQGHTRRAEIRIMCKKIQAKDMQYIVHHAKYALAIGQPPRQNVCMTVPMMMRSMSKLFC